jgi:3-oxoacyl-[acyl-carrier protein] reductase
MTASCPDRLKGRIAVVTGGGAGIGRATALRLAAEGARVMVNDLRGEAAASSGDVASEADVDALFAAVEALWGPAEIAVNNAGHVHQSPFETLAAADWDRMIAVHLRGCFLCCRRAIGPMLAAGRGAIVNMASQLGQKGGVELVHYSAAKAGIIGLTKALAREVSLRGVRVNAVAPGPINTELVMGLSEEWRGAKAGELPLGRFGEAEDVAATVAFLASDDAKIYVGQTLGPNSGDVML